MNYVVPSCTLRNLKSIGMGANRFCHLVRSKPFAYYGLLIPSLHLKVSSINIVQVYLDSTCLFEIADLVKSPVWLLMVTIVFSHGILDLFLGSIPMSLSLPPFQCFALRTWTDVSESVLLIVGLHDSKIIVQLKDPSL